MEKTKMISIVRSAKGTLIAHPDNLNNSEFSDRIDSLKELEQALSEACFMEWVLVKDRLPVELDKDWHLQKLWVKTKKYGCTVAFFKNGEFMKDYSAKLLDVIKWMELPEPLLV